MSGRLLALVDADSFYASCERVFRPDWAACPLVVLSYGDGIVIARCRRAKGLGISVGDFYPEIRRAYERAGGIARSSNFALYGDLSRRMFETLRGFSPRREVYSIDEVFLEVPVGAAPEAWGREVRSTVGRWTGLPVSVGIAPTKTLAKLATERAKEEGVGVHALATEETIRAACEATPVEEIWGIAHRSGRRLRARAIRTAADLADAPPRVVDAALGIQGLRIREELRGVRAIDLAEAPRPRKSALTSRTFGRAVTDRDEMREALATFATRAAEKARADGCVVGGVGVFLERRGEDGAHESASVALAVPTSATGAILAAARVLCDRIFREGASYRRAGVHLWGLLPAADRPGELFAPSDQGRAEKIDRAMDALNGRFGTGTVRPAACGLLPRWRARADQRSPAYTTAWRDLPIARAIA